MILSLMTVEKTVLRSLNLTTNPSWGRGNESKEPTIPEPVINYAVHKATDRPKFSVLIDIRLDWSEGPDSPFSSIQAVLSGFYSFPGETLEETMHDYVPTLCLVNLYGVARGLIAQATGLCAGGPFILPLVNMNEVVREFTQKLNASHEQKKLDLQPKQKTRRQARVAGDSSINKGNPNGKH